METRSCPACARPRTPADAAGLEWSSQHEPDGRVSWVCPTCTRDQLWRIETLLGIGAAAPAPIAPESRAA
jgi:hypothetical protein